MLSQRYDNFNLFSKDDWHPYPTAAERGSWERLPEAVRKQMIAHGEAALSYSWPSLLATRFLEVARIGNRENYQDERNERRDMVVALAFAECVEGEGRFVDQLVNGLWLILEESYWGVPAHLNMQAAGRGLPDTADPTVDLFAAETGNMLAYILYLLGPQLDAVSPLIRPRIEREIDTRILTPNLERDDFRWMGYNNPARRPNNWNPWINSNWLDCVLFIEPDPQRRLESVKKMMRTLDNFIDPYPQDGGCDEGPNYWNRAAASMFECLDHLHKATDGEIDVYDEPLVAEMGRFVYRAHIDGDYYVNFADASAIVYPDASLIYEYGERIRDADMTAYGAWLADRQGLITGEGEDAKYGRNPRRRLRTLYRLDDMAQADAYAPQPRAVWLPDIEVLFARDQERSAEGFYVAAKGGHNNESHNHNDVGQFIVFIDGLPVLMDAGVETYTIRTFSEERYQIWTMQSGYHNLPTIDGVMQAPGEQFAASDADCTLADDSAELRLNIATAYPPEAGLQAWNRRVHLARGQGVTVTDAYQLTGSADEITMSLLTASLVDLSQPGTIQLTGQDLSNGQQSGSGTVRYDADTFKTSVEAIDITDKRMHGSWGSRLYRVVLTAQNPPQQATWVLDIGR